MGGVPGSQFGAAMAPLAPSQRGCCRKSRDKSTRSSRRRVGISVATYSTMMTASHGSVPARQRADSAGILRWVFLRGTKAVTCEVTVCGNLTYDVCVVPHWDVSSSAIETFDRPASALRRHAEIACHFREAGWILVRESTRQT